VKALEEMYAADMGLLRFTTDSIVMVGMVISTGIELEQESIERGSCIIDEAPNSAP
jgi:hypothetical protein